MKYIFYLFLLLPLSCSINPKSQAQQGKSLLEDYPELGLPIVRDRAITSEAVRIEADCSRTVMHGVEFTVVWTDEKARMDNQRIDLSIYSGGLEADVYTTVWPAKVGQKCRPLYPAKFGEQGVHPSMVLEVIPRPKAKAALERSITLTGAEQGVNYYFRVLNRSKDGWQAAETIMVRAPICPSDSRE